MSEPARKIDWVFGEAVIRDPTGLHARPAVKLTKLAKTFRAVVEVRAAGDGSDEGDGAAGADGGWINAKSPNAVMKLKAAHGRPLQIRAEGEDAGAAVAALCALIDGNFDG